MKTTALQVAGAGRHWSPGFSLLELLVVVGLVAALSGAAFHGLAGGGREAAMRSSQALLANLVTAARLKAMGTGCKTRLLVNVDPGVPDRYLRMVVLQTGRQAGPSPANWDTSQRLSLPHGIFVVPASLAGLVATATDWKRVSDPTADLASDLFTADPLSHALEEDSAPQWWAGVAFTPVGTLATLVSGPPPKGALVIALGRRRASGDYEPGAPPIELEQPSAVRGLLLSAYGVPTLLRDRTAF
jgi:prepilin-type N-terminal cleavage/methylation domain-containing protein